MAVIVRWLRRLLGIQSPSALFASAATEGFTAGLADAEAERAAFEAEHGRPMTTDEVLERLLQHAEEHPEFWAAAHHSRQLWFPDDDEESDAGRCTTCSLCERLGTPAGHQESPDTSKPAES